MQLPRHAPRREGIRQLLQARPARNISRRSSDQGLDRSSPAHARRFQVAAFHSVRSRLRRKWRGRRYRPQRHPHLRSRAHLHPGEGQVRSPWFEDGSEIGTPRLITGSWRKHMTQNDTLHLAREFLRRLGSGAEPAEIAKLFSKNLEWEIAGDTGALPWI